MQIIRFCRNLTNIQSNEMTWSDLLNRQWDWKTYKRSKFRSNANDDAWPKRCGGKSADRGWSFETHSKLRTVYKIKNLNTSLMIRSMDRRSSPFIDGQIWTCRISSLRAEEQIQWWSNLITVSSRIKMTIKFKRKSFNGPNLIEAWNIFWIVGFPPCFIEKLLNFFNNKTL